MNPRDEVIETCNRLFIYTDDKAWDRVLELFDGPLHFDVTSMAGGEPADVDPPQVVDGWKTALEPIASVHHQVRNYLVTVTGDGAEVFCYGTATHHRPERAPPVAAFVGSYDLKLKRTERGWRITQFKFNLKYQA